MHRWVRGYTTLLYPPCPAFVKGPLHLFCPAHAEARTHIVNSQDSAGLSRAALDIDRDALSGRRIFPTPQGVPAACGWAPGSKPFILWLCEDLGVVPRVLCVHSANHDREGVTQLSGQAETRVTLEALPLSPETTLVHP